MVAQIKRLKFNLLSPMMIKKMAAVKITTSDVYDADAYPVPGGVMDPHMGVIDPGMRCKTCGGKSGECNGHFGYIELAKPILNILFIKTIKQLLFLTCQYCGGLLVDAEKLQKGVNINKLKPTKNCPSCGKPQGKLKFEIPQSFRRDKKTLNSEEIREQFEKISNRDVKLLGIEGGRPEWLILTLMAVPSITTRPSITLMNGERSEDDLTHKLVDIVRINQRLASNLEIGAPDFILEDLWELLQYHVTTFFNNEVSGIPPARHRSGRQLKTLTQRLKSKDGRFRHNLTGKRVDFSARTVISPDPNIGINEVGVPEIMAKELTIPIRVTEANSKYLRECVKKGPNVVNGANYIIRPDGLRKKITDKNIDVILEELSIGYIVERHISDGDIVLFNRQPSLHRMSIMAHRVRVMPDRTFRLNLTVCRPYNADFDGDEMNLHVPQTAEARAEAEQLMLVENNIRSPRFGGNIIGGEQDFISGSYLLSKKDTKNTKTMTAQMLAQINMFPDLTKREYTGKEIVSMILPDKLNLEYKSSSCKKCKVCTKQKCEYDAYVWIKDGQLMTGVIDEKAIAPAKGIIMDRIDQEFGHEEARKFLERITGLSTEFLMRRGFSISVKDEELPSHIKKEINKFVDKHLIEAKKLIDDYKKGKIEAYPGRNLEETLEEMVIKELQQILSESQELIRGNVKENDAVVMAKTGARGSIQNLTFMAGLIGQEALRGKRIFRGYQNRTLSHFEKNDLSPKAHGFVSSSYKEGLSPIEFFFESMKGREGIMDSSLKTRISGYMQRRLINALQDILVWKDGSARDGSKNIIQFVAGEDGIDPSKSDRGMIINL